MTKPKLPPSGLIQLTYMIVDGNKITRNQAVITEPMLEASKTGVGDALSMLYERVKRSVHDELRSQVVKDVVQAKL